MPTYTFTNVHQSFTTRTMYPMQTKVRYVKHDIVTFVVNDDGIIVDATSQQGPSTVKLTADIGTKFMYNAKNTSVKFVNVGYVDNWGNYESLKKD